MPVLDAEELLHLGLHALQKHDPHGAIENLKRCLEVDPVNAKAIYLLGAVYAQIGLYDRAKDSLQQAVTLNPQEYTAVFQLGLLHLTSGDVELARSAWTGLNGLDEQHFLRLFARGLSALVDDDFAGCIDYLERGIAANVVNPALNNDMKQMKVSVEAALANTAPGSDATTDVSGHLVLSGYRQAQNPDTE